MGPTVTRGVDPRQDIWWKRMTPSSSTPMLMVHPWSLPWEPCRRRWKLKTSCGLKLYRVIRYSRWSDYLILWSKLNLMKHWTEYPKWKKNHPEHVSSSMNSSIFFWSIGWNAPGSHRRPGGGHGHHALGLHPHGSGGAVKKLPTINICC